MIASKKKKIVADLVWKVCGTKQSLFFIFTDGWNSDLNIFFLRFVCGMLHNNVNYQCLSHNNVQFEIDFMCDIMSKS